MKNETIDITDVSYEEIEVVEIEDSFNYTMDIEVEDTHYYTINNGTVSHNSVSICSQTTSGVEPVFMVSYKRRRKVNPEDKEAKVNFIDDNGDSWEEYNVFHSKFEKWAVLNGYSVSYIKLLPQEELNEIIKLSPYYKATSADVDWVEKVRMQGSIQQWVDHSISVTVNIPKETTVETVNKIYTTAWESGCKGITIYRDGSRSGVLVSNDSENKEKFEYVDSTKRPKELDCDVHHITALGGKWIVLIGLNEGKPYEVFALKDIQNNIEFAKNYKKGKIVRRKKGVYDLIGIHKDTKNQTLLSDIASYFETDDERASTRKYSLMLRHRIHPKYIVSQAEEEPGSIVAFNKAIARTLKKYLTEEDLKSVVKACTVCGSENLAIQEGCLVCLDCGSSKCG
jgi:ribonucleoside-diphosphate reductase alpha chain